MLVNGIHTCPKCNEQDSFKFNKDSSKKSGLSSYCRECNRKNSSQYHELNGTKNNEQRREQYANDDEYRANVLEQGKRHRDKNKDEINATRRETYASDPEYKQNTLLKNEQWRHDNPEKVKNIRQQYYIEKKPEILAKNKINYINKKEEILAQQKDYRKQHPEQIANYSHEYYIENQDDISVYNKNYKLQHKDKIKIQRRELHVKKMQSDPLYKLVRNLRKRYSVALKRELKKGNNVIKQGSVVKDLGCSIQQLKEYLESKFYSHPTAGIQMTWDLWGQGYGYWNIDHIVELQDVDLNNREDFICVNHYTNLQPLWFEDHINKGKKYD